MRRSLAQFGAPEPSGHTRFSAGSATTTFGFGFSVYTAAEHRRVTQMHSNVAAILYVDRLLLVKGR